MDYALRIPLLLTATFARAVRGWSSSAMTNEGLVDNLLRDRRASPATMLR